MLGPSILGFLTHWCRNLKAQVAWFKSGQTLRCSECPRLHSGFGWHWGSVRNHALAGFSFSVYSALLFPLLLLYHTPLRASPGSISLIKLLHTNLHLRVRLWGTDLKFWTMENSSYFKLIEGPLFLEHKMYTQLLHQSRSQKETVDEIQLGTWRIVNKRTNYKGVSWVQRNKDNTCPEAVVWDFISNLRPHWQEES